MKELLNYIVENILPKEANFSIEEQIIDEAIIYNILVSHDMVGILVGKEGNLIRAIKTLLKASPHSKNQEIVIRVDKMEEAK